MPRNARQDDNAPRRKRRPVQLDLVHDTVLRGEPTEGGERERLEEPTSPDVDVAIIRDRRSWGPITSEEVFWAYWLLDDNIPADGEEDG